MRRTLLGRTLLRRAWWRKTFFIAMGLTFAMSVSQLTHITAFAAGNPPAGSLGGELSKVQALPLQIGDLDNRLNQIEQELFRLNAQRSPVRASGGLAIAGDWYGGELEAYIRENPGTWPELDFVSLMGDGLRLTQAVRLNLDSDYYKPVYFHLGLVNYGFWGVAPGGLEMAESFTDGPLRVNELTLRWTGPEVQVTAGSQYFQLGPLGLLSSRMANAAEWVSNTVIAPAMPALRVDAGLGKGAGQVTAIGGKWTAHRWETAGGQSNIVGNDSGDYAAGRIAWRLGSFIFGANVTQQWENGADSRRGYSADFTGAWRGRQLSGEFAGWNTATAAIISADLFRTQGSVYNLQLGYAGPEFAPTFSALADTRGNLPLAAGTRGYMLSAQWDLSKFGKVQAEFSGQAGKKLALAGELLGSRSPKSLALADGESESNLTRLGVSFSKALSPATWINIRGDLARLDDRIFSRIRTAVDFEF